MSDDRSFLPPTATDLATALDILEDRLLSLPVSMVTKDPQAVSVALLDHLAWEESVDVWDLDWSEDIKRAVIAASAEVHRFKGTPYAIRQALAAFDVDVDLLEWWQDAGVSAGLEAGSFQVTAYAGASLYAGTENSLDARMLAAITAVVQRVSPVSRKLVFRLGERFQTGVTMRAASRRYRIARADLSPQPRPMMAETAVGFMAGVRLSRRSVCDHNPVPRAVIAGVAAVMRAGTRLRMVSRQNHDIQRRVAE
jgi:phage tail P2-like protein